jgi:hypothetical protein
MLPVPAVAAAGRTASAAADDGSAVMCGGRKDQVIESNRIESDQVVVGSSE